MDSGDDLIRSNRELRALAAAVCKETEELWATYRAIRRRSLDLLPRIQAPWSASTTNRMRRRPSANKVDSATKRWPDGSSSAMGSNQDADG
jgi:hypothetical protein